MYDINKSLIDSKTVNINVIDNVAPSSIKNILNVGDSLTSYGDITKRIQANFTGLGSNIPVFNGSQGSGLYKHEGRGGWALSTFVGASSPFYHNGALDIANYRSDIGLVDLLDFVTIQLGINDVGNTVVKDNATLDFYMVNYKLLIDAFITDNPNCKVIIGLPSSDCNTIDGYGGIYNATAYKANYQVNIFNFRQKMIDNFDNGIYNANVIIDIVGLQCDRYYGYKFQDKPISAAYPTMESVHSDCIHPAVSGYNQMGDSLFSIIQGEQ